MSSIEKRVRNGQSSWRAHYRAPDGRQRNKTFARKIDAERFLVTIESSKLTGSYLDPGLARVSVSAWSARWLAAQAHLKPSTRERYAGLLREHVTPHWGHVRLSDVSHADVQSWVSELAETRSASTARKSHRVLSLVLALAVRDRRLVRNAADGVRLPREVRRPRRFLTHEQVGTLADAAGAQRLVVSFLAYTGVRFGELAALRVGNLDLLRRRATIAESVTAVNGTLTWGTPKGHEHRDVPIPRFLVEELAVHLTGKGSDDLVFDAPHGGVLRASNFRRDVFEPAARAAGLEGLVPHELRHTAASLAIESGADVKVVQQMLGHKSATMTLDLYGHLFPDRLDEVADALDVAARASRRTSPVVTARVVNLRAEQTGR